MSATTPFGFSGLTTVSGNTSGPITSVTVGGSGSPVTAPASPIPPEMLPCASVGGHKVGSTVRYVDGLVVGRCERCDDRVTIWLAGGSHVPEAEGVASVALDMAKEGQPAEALALLQLFGDTLQADTEALAEAQSIFETVKAGISRILVQGK